MSRPGDWMCGSCQHLNFKKRDACQKCSYSKLEAPPIDQCSRQHEVLAGDWYCGAMNCSAHNYANRLNCYQCGALKNFDGVSQMMAMGGGHSSFYGSSIMHMPGWKNGDWLCKM
ncbi:hypothetical protein QQ045_022823 [Rhodiola kirilowii]